MAIMADIVISQKGVELFLIVDSKEGLQNLYFP